MVRLADLPDYERAHFLARVPTLPAQAAWTIASFLGTTMRATCR